MDSEALADGITIQTNAYALLTAVQLQERTWADKTAEWLVSQENYNGGYRSTHVNIMVAKTNLKPVLFFRHFDFLSPTGYHFSPGGPFRVRAEEELLH